MKKKALKAALAFFICWVFFVALEGLLLIGSTDPGKAPLIVLGGAHIADEIDAYSSLGFSQTYYLTYPDSLLGIIFNGFCFINLIPHFFDYLMCPYYPALYDGLLSNCYRW